jgi:KxDL motif-containing protein 1
VEHLIRGQKQMLMRFEKTNEMMVNCNQLSVNRLKMASDDFKKHTKQLQEMKKDLDYIFKKICNIKTKLNQQYPTSFAEARQKIQNVTLDEADEEQETITNTSLQPSGSNTVDGGKPDLIVLQKSSVEKRKPNKNNIDYVKMEGQTSPMNQRRSLISNQSSSTDNSSDSG